MLYYLLALAIFYTAVWDTNGQKSRQKILNKTAKFSNYIAVFAITFYLANSLGLKFNNIPVWVVKWCWIYISVWMGVFVFYLMTLKNVGTNLFRIIIRIVNLIGICWMIISLITNG